MRRTANLPCERSQMAHPAAELCFTPGGYGRQGNPAEGYDPEAGRNVSLVAVTGKGERHKGNAKKADCLYPVVRMDTICT
jgi:hypothetical protein